MQRQSRTDRRPTVRPFMLLAFLVAGATLHATSGAWALEFTPHRAYYKMQMIWSKPGTGIASIDGDLAAEWDQSCAGWTLTQKSLLNIYDPAGRKRVALASTISTWESADGKEYRFKVRNATNGRDTDVIEGIARLPSGRSKKGWAQFEKPKKNRIELPPGTIFPTWHTIVVMREMPKAPTIVSKFVFDGLTEQGVHEINAVVGRKIDGGSKRPELRGRAAWPVQLAFFKPKATTSAPEYEIGMRLFDNGVGDNMVIDYGTFKVRAVLDRLEMGKRATCN